ncbi:GNAT family N-acetyltransferase [Priestia koreensis]|uniref:GNAT family N-acetyltransferase n=1 Tax=Priestia koreensis TaxID=284581 RepID=UPI001F5ABDF9|nr:GNAT family N-acetyltransferase [Priestia koreensis]MCM3003119.1 GNAT family N-acetyltransferase [Priestia koreensis]UNL85927.1 GNAT family N-acetyltransferase [Priestia koreensis]
MYQKKCYVFDQKTPRIAIIRNYTPSDFSSLIRVQQEAFPPPFPSELWWSEEQLHEHVTRFPEGALCAEIDGTICGSITGLRVKTDDHPHTWSEITSDGFITNHTNSGQTLYIVDICVSPAYRKLGIGKLLMSSMYEVVVQLKIDRLLGGGRIPHYHRYQHELSPEQYLDGIRSGRIADPVITFLMRCGRTPVGIVPHYIEDEESLHHAVLMEWKNPFLST